MTPLAIIADLYTPLLLLGWLYCRRKAAGQLSLKPLLIGAALVYSLMALDKGLNIWPALGMDYSTHSALALLLVVALSLQNKVLLGIAPLSLCAYFYLMHLLNYHSVADMLTTSLLLLPAFVYLHKKGK